MKCNKHDYADVMLNGPVIYQYCDRVIIAANFRTNIIFSEHKTREEVKGISTWKDRSIQSDAGAPRRRPDRLLDWLSVRLPYGCHNLCTYENRHKP